jgi:hypothetical protein
LSSDYGTSSAKTTKPRQIVKAATPHSSIPTTQKVASTTAPDATTSTGGRSSPPAVGDSPVVVPSSSSSSSKTNTSSGGVGGSGSGSSNSNSKAPTTVVADHKIEESEKLLPRRHNATLAQSPPMAARELQQESMEQHCQEQFQSHMAESKSSREREINSRRHPSDEAGTSSKPLSSTSSNLTSTTSTLTSNPFTRFWSAFRVDNSTHKHRRGGASSSTKQRRKVAVISPERVRTEDDKDFEDVDGTVFPPAEKKLHSDSDAVLTTNHSSDSEEEEEDDDDKPSLFHAMEQWWDDWGVTSRTGAAKDSKRAQASYSGMN